MLTELTWTKKCARERSFEEQLYAYHSYQFLSKCAFSNAVVDDVRRSFLYVTRLKLVQISFILNLFKPLHNFIHKKVANCNLIIL